MNGLLGRELVVLAGKGGVGRTTTAAAVGVVASERGARTIVVEVGEQARVPALLGARPAELGETVRLTPSLAAMTIDPDRALLRWLQKVGGRAAGRLLASSSTFQYFAAAAPGARELVVMVAIWQLTAASPERGEHFDLVVVDAPASGHALAMLGSPATFGSIARVGPIAHHSEEVTRLLGDELRSGYLAVTLADEMAVTETLELRDALAAKLGRDLDGVIVNQLLPRRFSDSELERAEALRPRGATASAVRAAVRAARDVETRARTQQSHLRRLRASGLDVVTVPFLWSEEVGREEVDAIAARLARRLAS
ncbi:MAG TPA: ArsA family ATPase [Solirubrobacteraceae bacterium]|nr:ArsA family ATPase [Solirubrobacteraceae bacterium]